MDKRNKAIYKELQKLEEKLEQIENASIKRTMRGFKRDLIDLKEILNKLYREYEVDGEFNYGRFKRFKDNKMLNDYVAATLVNRYIIVERETQAALRLVTDTTFNTMKNLEAIPGIKKTFDVDKVVHNKMAGIRWTERYGIKRSQAIKNIQSTIKQGLEAGDTYTTMSQKLGEQIAGEVYQVDRIVRTEAHRCINEAKLETLKEINKDYPIYKKWVSASDERTRTSHGELDGTTIPVEDNFQSSTGGVGPGPGQMGLPEEDCNCRCWLVMELREKGEK